MKHAILAFLLCIGSLHLHAADEPLIPAALNAILPKIRGGMTVQQVKAVLASSYPNVKGEGVLWSGQNGYIDYKLDDRFSLSISFTLRDGKTVVHDDLLFYVQNYSAKHRVDIKSYFYDSPAQKRTKFIGQ
jgi:hypothetical protein